MCALIGLNVRARARICIPRPAPLRSPHISRRAATVSPGEQQGQCTQAPPPPSLSPSAHLEQLSCSCMRHHARRRLGAAPLLQGARQLRGRSTHLKIVHASSGDADGGNVREVCAGGDVGRKGCGARRRLRTSLWKSGTAQPHFASCFSSSPSRIFSKRSYISLCWHGCAESASIFSCNPQLARSTRNARRRTTQTKASYRQRVLARTQRLSKER